MNNDLAKKRRLTTGTIIGGVVGAMSAFLSSWLRNEFGLDFLKELI